MPKVLNKYHGNIPTDAIDIMRPSIWGNHYIIGMHGTRDQCCDKYEQYILHNPELLIKAKRELRGRDLVCCCAPKRCHGDTLLKIANED